MVDVRELNNKDEESYNNFVRGHALGMFYYSWNYKCFLENILSCKSHYLIAEKNNEVTGVFPLMVLDGTYGKVWNSLPFYGSHGDVLSNDEETYNALYKYAQSKFFDKAASYTIIQNPLEGKSNKDSVTTTATHQDFRIGQWTSLPENKENLLNILDSSTRRNIKKAKKSNIDVSVNNEDWLFLEDVHKANMFEIGGRAKSYKFFKYARENFNAGVDYNIYVAKIDEEKVSALLVFYYKDIVEYFTPVTLSQHRNSQPSAGVIYKAMLDSIDNGFKWWNWGGTWKSQEGVYKFKRKWGAEDKLYKYNTCLNNMNILNSSPEELLEVYPGFYVVPFNELNSRNET